MSYISEPTVSRLYKTQNELIKDLSEQINSFVKNPTNSDRAYIILESGNQPLAFRLIFNAKRFIRTETQDPKVLSNVLMITNQFPPFQSPCLLTVLNIAKANGLEQTPIESRILVGQKVKLLEIENSFSEYWI